MSAERFFLDTVFIQASLNRADQYHAKAVALASRVRDAAAVLTTEAILTETANALSTINRAGVVRFIEQAYRTSNIQIVSIDTPLFQRALHLYGSRPDKQWGLTDCISFVVMQDQNLRDALTADKHFIQAGFQAMLSI